MRPEQGSPVRADTDAGALLERLQKLRSLLPAFAQETAAARREAARLRVQNTTLQTRLAELEARARRHDTATINRKRFQP
jgi:phage shock protein A